MESKEPFENRPEPRVEVDADLEEFEERRGPDWSARPVPERKPITRWVLGPILLAALAGLGYAFWLIWGMKPVTPAKPSVPSEIMALKGEVQKLTTELSAIRKELGDVQAEQKTTAEKLSGLQGHWATLSKKMESVPARKAEKPQEKKPVRKTQVYKIQPGDTVPSVARKFGVDQEDIRRWNNLPARSGLQVGQLLTIYSGASR
jgi:LysM repeat protein